MSNDNLLDQKDTQDILKAEIHCMTPPSKEQCEKIRQFILEEYNVKDAECIVKIDPAVVGGFNIFVGDDNYDWSTLGRIRQLRKSFQSLNHETQYDKIISLFKENIEDFNLDAGHQQVGLVVTVNDGIAIIEGLHDVEYGEIVLFDCGVKGMVQDIRTDGTAGIVLFGDDREISEGSRVLRTRRTAGIPINNSILGRMIDPLGRPIDDKGDIKAKRYYPIERVAPAIMDRRSVTRPLETGILAIDSMFPIGKGQRELIIGDRQTGKTSVAVDTILNCKGKDVICVYVAIGQKASSVMKVINTLEKNDALDYTVIVSSPASDPAPLQYIAPYTGCAVGEYFMYHGRDVLIVYDDLSKHAVAYRTLSLLLERSPGREAYPGDVFYLHSRLLERSAQLNDKLGGGSMTALPIIETQAGDVSAYIPTNVISITDGQIFLESELSFAGQRPAVNVGLSVSRVGGAAQAGIMKKSVGTVRLDLAQYREMQVFSQFGGDLDEQTVKDLKYGASLMQLLRQPNQSPMKLWEQIVTLVCANERMFSDFPTKEVKRIQTEFLSHLERNHTGICLKIGQASTLTEEIKAAIIDYANRFFTKHLVL